MRQLFEREVWIKENFGATDFGDKRLCSRLIKMASKMCAYPEGSLPQQMENFSELKGAYRFLGNEKVTHKRVQAAHKARVKKQVQDDGNTTKLFIQDGSEIESHETTKNAGPIGNHTCVGMMMHNCLAVKYDITNPEIIGLAHQEVWTREHKSLCRSETRHQRNKRNNKESDIWLKTLKTIGSPSEGCNWVSIGDRGNDIYEFFRGAAQLNWNVLVRACQDRAIEVAGEERYLKEWAKSLPVMGTKIITIRKKGETKPKQIELNIAWGEIKMASPKRLSGEENISISVVVCWNDEEEIDWILYSSIPVNNFEEASEKIEWYACRWIVEEYHKCLKTGCRIEASQLESIKGRKAHLGILAILAIQMLQLRNASREDVERKANTAVPEVAIKLICKRYSLNNIEISIREFWHSVAKLGGFIGRKSDGDPGWQTLWKGWLRLLDMICGAEALTST